MIFSGRTIGRTISVALAAQTPGAAVLRFPQPNLIGHIVFSDGNGGTDEAHLSATGLLVIKLTNPLTRGAVIK